MTVLIIDGQGGSIGKQLVNAICAGFPEVDVIAVGTNSIATANMLKGGNVNAATGENAVIVACRKADVIVGPIGIVIADALMGEVTPKMAKAIGQSNATRILIPMNKCDSLVAGLPNVSTGILLEDAMNKLEKILSVHS